MERNSHGRLNEYNESQRKRAKYIERGEKKIQEGFGGQKELYCICLRGTYSDGYQKT